jgi:UDP-N-acetylmuramoylalanine--D-glutamate ligase
MNIDLRNKKVSIVGAGKSGLSSAEIIKALGGIPFISDNAELKDNTVGDRLSTLGVKSEFGGHSESVFNSDLMIVSPGVPANADVIIRAKSRGITVWPEIELAYRLCQGGIIGITGSNGKTTTTALIGEILKNAGIPAFVCGNIGFPFIDIAQKVPSDGFAVVELSSFQLEQIDKFRANIAVFLNLTPDHLDRHGNLDTYIAAKMRIFENQGPQDTAVINSDDPILHARCAKLKSQQIWFSVGQKLKNGIWADPVGEIFNKDSILMNSSDIRIKGEHNLSNACAAIAAAISAGAPENKIIETLKSFAGVEHRLEPVRLIGGVSFINDSKGTNVDSVFWALKAVSAPVILIAGGKDKNGDFSALNEMVSKKVKLVILIGQASNKIETTWNDLATCVRADTMGDAVRLGLLKSLPGDTVLLSPGCASFDMFNNYEHRGKVFKQAVLDIEPKGIIR